MTLLSGHIFPTTKWPHLSLQNILNCWRGMRSSESANLDFLRAGAVMLVLCQHLCRRLYIHQVLWIDTSSLGRFGVLLFFVHTSLVLMQSMARSEQRGWPLIRAFYIRRLFRIYPLSILVVLFALAFRLDSDINGVAGLSRGSFPGRLSIVSNLLLLQNLFHIKSIVNVLWSLPFEVEMYVLLPFLFLRLTRTRRIWLLVPLWCGSLAAALIQPQVRVLSSLSILAFSPNFLSGVIAFMIPRAERIASHWWPVFVLALICIFTAHPSMTLGWLLCLILGCLIPRFQELNAAPLRALTSRIAKYSYGIYLTHQFSIWIAFGLMASASVWIRVPMLLGLLISLPFVVYHGVEKPMIDWGMRLATRNPKPAIPVIQGAAAA